MTRQQEIEIMSRQIADRYGKDIFQMGEVHKIVGCGINRIAGHLKDSGIAVKKIGNRKVITAAQLAEYLFSGRVSAIDNRRKVG